MEKFFVNTNFPYVHVVQIPNGKTWTPERLSEHIVSKYNTLNMVSDKVVVWLDKENHVISIDDYRLLIKTKLVNAGVSENKICILIPDMMTENIILSDEFLIREEFDCADFEYPGCGCNGKAKLRELYAQKGNPENYKETSHGAMLLKKIRMTRCSEKSLSARLFLEDIDLECWWF